jgi:predicted metal-dependent phosphoesterase TrpH
MAHRTITIHANKPHRFSCAQIFNDSSVGSFKKLFYPQQPISPHMSPATQPAHALFGDLHIHTVYSPDSLIQPKTLVDMLSAHSYIKVAAVTDHDSVRGCKATIELASDFPDILIIPGVEISTTNGDMLVLGTDELPPKPWTPEVVADYARTIDGVSIVAHPFRLYGMGDYAKKVKVDALEVLNGGSSKEANNQAKELAKALGLPGTAGSDAHQVSELFAVCNRVEASLNVDDILRAIKRGLVTAQLPRAPIHL